MGKSGRLNARSWVRREGVRLVEGREKRLMVLDAALARGLADVEAGRFKPIEEVAARLKAKYAAMAKDGGK
ncbi:type II toxin-antitoxin system ParD family antitoxin [Neorhizobium galegae]|uniref:type II toxin-antitoxin system ParD family antitoxin n=1 Tax=Neorhizobium galegae TaxID=399 RepID=UPI002102D609|nr:type II toxin-antitoxin system ParD family antitoxin [Neorhizobium galegae]MCQ1856414.1 type II toxin-antitoxin system ParD family antitoxin [Neorhizobium galegae]